MNSLYGRFGMNSNFPNVNIIHKDFYSDFEVKNFDNIIKTTKIDDYYLIETENLTFENDESSYNNCISIAAAITAYSRIYMSQFKNNPEINLYYSDTDSIYVDDNSKIDTNLINNKELGKLKLENVCKKAIFLAPKVYCLLTEDGRFLYKVKGLKHEVELTISDFKHLLKKDALIKKHQDQCFRKLSDGKIDILKEVYTLQVTDNKRKLIYDENNKLIGTTPYIINENKEIINK
jgi:hypothetical protein